VLAAVLGTLGFSVLAGILVTVLVTPALAVTGVVVKSGVGIFDSLPTYISIGQLPGPNEIFAEQNGQPVQIATIFDENRQEVNWDQIAQTAKDAAVDGEDARFYHHGGVDLPGITRAALTSLVGSSGSSPQGASTITQQLVKNIFVQQALQLPVDQQKAALQAATALTLDRKLKEAKLAISLEKKDSKKEILQAYLNIAPFGGNTYGIQAAAQRYYGVNASQLTVAQAATLIAIVQNPNLRAPINTAGYAANLDRRNYILSAMLKAKDITQAQYDEALKTPVDATTVKNIPASQGCQNALANTQFWCAYVTNPNFYTQLTALGATVAERKANWKVGGYKIYTSLDLDLQNAAQKVENQYVAPTLPRMDIGGGITSVEVGTGRILDMVQNKAYSALGNSGPGTTPQNYNVDRKYGGSAYGFQGASTYKPFTLMNWLQHGHGLNEIVSATPTTWKQSSFKDRCEPAGQWAGPPFSPKNDEAGERGPMTVMKGTAESVNAVFVNMGEQLDQCDTRDDAAAFGVHQGSGLPLQHNPAAIIGSNAVAPLTMAAAYAGIANGGMYCEATAVDSVVSPAGKKLAGQPKTCTQALASDIDAAVGVAMQGVFNSGTATQAKPKGVNILGKTGTTDNSSQTWTVGASTKVSTAVWIGNATGSAVTRATSSQRKCSAGSTVAVLRNCVFRDTMTAINAKYPGGSFPTAPAQYLTGTTKALPDVTGQSVTAATATLQGLGYSVTVNPTPVASAEPQGTVAQTDPGAGTRVSKGYQVTIYTSDGSQAKTVPNVNGEMLNQAKNDIASAGFTNPTTDVCTVDPDPTHNNRVTSTSPAQGTTAPPSTTITVNYLKTSC
jgi:membrane peptidoglycan carboxypeptidase